MKVAVAQIALCRSDALLEGGDAVPFELLYRGEAVRAFAIRFEGQVRAYLNRCTHVPMEMDYQPNRFFDFSGHWLVCATHGAHYWPATGACLGGPCRGALVPVALSEHDGQVHWHTSDTLQPPTAPP